MLDALQAIASSLRHRPGEYLEHDSELGSFYASGAKGAALYFAGPARHDPRLAETGRLGVVIDSGTVTLVTPSTDSPIDASCNAGTTAHCCHLLRASAVNQDPRYCTRKGALWDQPATSNIQSRVWAESWNTGRENPTW